jgi:hypothetical protein
MAKKELNEFKSRQKAGKKSEVPGLLEQWLMEGKMSEQDALNESIGIFTGGVDTVSAIYLLLN